MTNTNNSLDTLNYILCGDQFFKAWVIQTYPEPLQKTIKSLWDRNSNWTFKPYHPNATKILRSDAQPNHKIMAIDLVFQTESKTFAGKKPNDQH